MILSLCTQKHLAKFVSLSTARCYIKKKKIVAFKDIYNFWASQAP